MNQVNGSQVKWTSISKMQTWENSAKEFTNCHQKINLQLILTQSLNRKKLQIRKLVILQSKKDWNESYLIEEEHKASNKQEAFKKS